MIDFTLIDRMLDLHYYSFLIVARVTGFMMVAPGVGDILIPVRVRLVASVMIAVAVFPLLDLEMVRASDGIRVFVLALTEIGTGLALGLLLRSLIFALQIAGSIAAQATSLAQLVGGAGTDPMPAVGHIITMSGVVAAFSFGLHIRIIEYLANSYNILPLGSGAEWSGLGELILRQLSFAFQLAFTLSVPFLIVALLYNLTLGFINRAMPQLMVALVGAPAIAGGAILILVLLLPAMITLWHQAFSEFIMTFEVP